MKQRAQLCMQAGAKGVKIMVAGRLGGAEMSRTEAMILGSIPLHTLEADIDYGFAPSFTTYGVIGCKVWIYRGMFGEAPTEEEQTAAAAMTRARRRRERVGGGGGGGRDRDRRDGGSPQQQTMRPGGSRLGGRQQQVSQPKPVAAPEQTVEPPQTENKQENQS
jgi:small subunit ribosomal protein S3